MLSNDFPSEYSINAFRGSGEVPPAGRRLGKAPDFGCSVPPERLEEPATGPTLFMNYVSYTNGLGL